MKKQINLFFYIFMVLITSWNCNGLFNVAKMKRVFNLFDDRNYDIIALQKTHWKDKFIEYYKRTNLLQ